MTEIIGLSIIRAFFVTGFCPKFVFAIGAAM